MAHLENDNRLNDILDMIGRIAALDFSQELPVSDKSDMLDAISMGLNMLSEELQTNVVEKSKINEVNAKLEKFAFTAAHDLKSPINAISGIIYLLERSIHEGSLEDTGSYVRILKESTEKMKNLVQGILEYSRVDTSQLELESISLESVIHEIVELDGIKKQARLHIIGDLPTVVFNKSAIFQVLRNLISNAIKYSNKDLCTIEVKAEEKGSYYQISVSDDGPGIAKENQDRIFELFNKIETAIKKDSQGIGLATAKNTLNTFGERIWVESEIGNGATFFFTISKYRTKIT